MGRSPTDKTPQRVLVHQLKRAIDMIPFDRQAGKRVRHLVSENPHSARSTHVIRNLGTNRVRVLEEILGEPLVSRVRATRAAPPPGHTETTRNS